MSDTIFALATAPGRAALAVVRISGPEAAKASHALTGGLPDPRRASLRRLRDPVSHETLDQALVLFMAGPNSFTGEDVVELHLHGGRAVVNGVLTALETLGLRVAGPGEFTRRAFERGILDLTEAEAVADLIDADSSAQRRQALAQLSGSTARKVELWRDKLVQSLALFEAAIDFPDEDIPQAVSQRAEPLLKTLLQELDAATGDLRGERIRSGFHVALVGAPNAGKSSLFNSIVKRDAAIVTNVAGTTRDIIEVELDLGGYRVVLADMAGLRDASDQVEAEGVRRARNWAAKADLRLWVVDGSQGSDGWQDGLESVRQGDFLVITKSDLSAGAGKLSALTAGDALELEPIETSTIAVGGVIELFNALERRVERELGGRTPPAATRVRHRQLFAKAAANIRRALDGVDPELIAEDIRLAARELEVISGKVDPDVVLGEIFSTFCIGK